MRIHVGPGESVVAFDLYERHTYGFRHPVSLASLGVVSYMVDGTLSQTRSVYDQLQQEPPAIENPVETDLLLDQILHGMRLSRVLAGAGGER